MCDYKIGAFAMIHEIAVRTHHTFETLEMYFDYSDLGSDMISRLLFGEPGHTFIDVVYYFDTYIFAYTNMLSEMGGAIERNLDLLARILDPFTFPFIYDLVKEPICGMFSLNKSFCPIN
jgi:hypothetical protein